MPTFKKKSRGLKKPKDVKKLLSQLKFTGKKTRKKKKPKPIIIKRKKLTPINILKSKKKFKLGNKFKPKKTFKLGNKFKPKKTFKSKKKFKLGNKFKPKKTFKKRYTPNRGNYDKFILVKQPSKNMLRLNVYPEMDKLMVTQTEDPHYQSYSFSDAQSSHYMTGQEPQYQRLSQEETNIDGAIKGKLLMDDNGEMYMINY